MPRKLKITADGSPTFYLPHKNESYHSIHGALTESLHVFINSGLEHWLELNPLNSSLDLLEVGFGTGLNFLLTSSRLKNTKRLATYEAIEAYPLSIDEVEKFSLNNSFKDYFSSQELMELHRLPWERVHYFESTMSIKKIKSKVESFSFEKKYDVVYYDVFAKFLQPELWTSELIQLIANQVKKNGVFITYAAFGELRNALSKSNMNIERIKGPRGKREITRAIKH
ncbi:MAG: tRNA (5-methylaminomethyl-2-thiouridine)(34)-methyltransferase MnmD [Flavobacteriaceae bacterium]|nr:tRNA (5-methylaminomethyl-2-thiouridine)(34)-methyltransferase MnmD [Flavobacteriaceae bacterium]